MNCKFCGGRTIVTNTYDIPHPTSEPLNVVVRARKCLDCGQYMGTVEAYKDVNLSNVRDYFKSLKKGDN